MAVLAALVTGGTGAPLWEMLVKYENLPDGHPKSIVATDDKGKIIKDVSYVWSPQGKLQQRVLDGVLHEYRYDALGRLTEVNKSQVSK